MVFRKRHDIHARSAELINEKSETAPTGAKLSTSYHYFRSPFARLSTRYHVTLPIRSKVRRLRKLNIAWRTWRLVTAQPSSSELRISAGKIALQGLRQD